MERQENASCCTVSKTSLCPLLNLETVFSQWSSPGLRASSHRKAAMQVFAAWVLTGCSAKPQMSLSSFGNFSASGAATLRAPDCSSALGLYVPSVCLFFLTTQNNQTRKAETIASTPKVTVGATMAAMLGPVELLDWMPFWVKVSFPHTGLLLSTSSKTLPTTAPGMVSTSRHAAISTRDQQGQMGADWYSGGISLGPFHSQPAAVRIYCLHLNSLHPTASRWSRQNEEHRTGWFLTRELLPPHLKYPRLHPRLSYELVFHLKLSFSLVYSSLRHWSRGWVSCYNTWAQLSTCNGANRTSFVRTK